MMLLISRRSSDTLEPIGYIQHLVDMADYNLPVPVMNAIAAYFAGNGPQQYDEYSWEWK